MTIYNLKTKTHNDILSDFTLDTSITENAADKMLAAFDEFKILVNLVDSYFYVLADINEYDEAKLHSTIVEKEMQAKMKLSKFLKKEKKVIDNLIKYYEEKKI